MARDSKQSSNWQFQVIQRQLQNPKTGEKIPMWGNFREDTEQCLGVTSEQYGLVQNTALMSTAIAALEARGLKDYEQRMVVSGDGQRFYAELTFKNRNLATAIGDLLGYKFIIKNSFDRSLRTSLGLGFLRLACLNGMTTTENEFAITRKHSAQVTVDFLGDAIDKALAAGKSALSIFDTLASVAITDEQGQNILAHFEDKKLLSGTLREHMLTLWLAPRRQEDKARNLYNLYNAMTEYLTHQVGVERYEYAGKVGDNVLMTLVNAARKPEQLSKIIVPAPKAGTSIVVNVPATFDVVDAAGNVTPVSV